MVYLVNLVVYWSQTEKGICLLLLFLQVFEIGFCFE